MGLISSQGTKILHATHHGQYQNQTKKKDNKSVGFRWSDDFESIYEIILGREEASSCCHLGQVPRLWLQVFDDHKCLCGINPSQLKS